MTMIEPPAIRVHEDSDSFREAVNFTAAETKFAARLIEKDYFCTVLLGYFGAAVGEELIFKGGTCLAKVHADFYRLSEDLDFASSQGNSGYWRKQFVRVLSFGANSTN